MPVDTREIMSLLSDLGDEKGMKVAITHSAKGGFITGICSMLGGLIMGPIGLAAG